MNQTVEYQTVFAVNRKFGFREAGDGPALVLLHGIGSNSGSWINQLVTLSEQFRVLAWDAPGYGDSTPLDNPQPQAKDYAEALAMFLDSLRVQKCCLVGHSLGTLIASSFVRNYARTNALVLVSCALGYKMKSGEPLPEQISDRLKNLDELGPEGVAQARAKRLLSYTATYNQVEQVREAMAKINPEGYQHATMMLAQGDLIEDAVLIKIPCLLLCGSEDQITPETHSKKVAKVISGAQYQSLMGAGHVCYIEQPETFNGVLTNFFLQNRL